MKFVYLDKKDRLRIWFTPRRSLALAGIAGGLALLPLWHETGDGRFVLEAADRAVVRTLVPGTVAEVYADEGQRIMSGAPLVQLHNAALESKLARSQTDYRVANAVQRTRPPALCRSRHGTSDRDRLARRTDACFQVTKLDLRSPISGVVLTPRLAISWESYLVEGTELVEVADMSTMRARIYVSEHDMYKYGSMSYARLQVDGMFGFARSGVVNGSPPLPRFAPGLLDLSKYQGLRPPNFYAANCFFRTRTETEARDGRDRPLLRPPTNQPRPLRLEKRSRLPRTQDVVKQKRLRSPGRSLFSTTLKIGRVADLQFGEVTLGKFTLGDVTLGFIALRDITLRGSRSATSRLARSRLAKSRFAGSWSPHFADADVRPGPLATIAFLVVFRVLIKDFFWIVMGRSSNLFWIEFHHSAFPLARAMPNRGLSLESR